MNTSVQLYIEELKAKSDVIGILLFGSWARGDNRLDSDVDLIILLEDGFKRTVEYKNDIAFEITYTTPKAIISFWESNIDDCANLWEIAQVLYDRDGTVANLQQEADIILSAGKKALSDTEFEHSKFDTEDQLKAINALLQKDPATAGMLLQRVVFNLCEKYFDVKQMWTPAPKQQLAKIKQVDDKLYNLFIDFYTEVNNTSTQLEIAKKISQIIYR